MGNLKEYSGLTTKVKAMRSKLLSSDDFSKIIELDTVPQVAEYLREKEGYIGVMGPEDMTNIHRETVEYAIISSGYTAFEKLYKFADMEQRKYLKLYFRRFEIEIIKKAIRKSNKDYMTKTQVNLMKVLFSKRSNVDFDALFNADSMEEIIRVLEGTIYYEPLKCISDMGRKSLFDYELALDMFYFQYIWKKSRTSLKRDDQKTISDCIGTEVDLLNITWIFRAKKIYKMTQSEIAAMIIPIYKRVRKPQIARMIGCSEVDELISEIKKTSYGKYFSEDIFERLELDNICKIIVKKIFNKYYKTEPYSIAIMSAYLRDKKIEMNNLTTIVECIRYGYPKDQIDKVLL